MEQLEMIRSLIEEGDNTAAMGAMLDTIAELMEQVDILNVQMETLLETLGDGEDETDETDDCSYIVTCGRCECVIEVEAWLLEEETAELSCPKCGARLEM